MCLEPGTVYDFTPANNAHKNIGEDYLLEMALGSAFFDFIAGAMGFEKAVYRFLMSDMDYLIKIRQKYIENQIEFIRKACAESPFESFFVGCSYSCNSLIGPEMWREWDKPYLKAMADEIHKHGKFLHIHFHGKSMETLEDFVEIEVDCVCPFERPPGGDIDGLEGLEKIRQILGGKVTMNGNVHTVETLIRGTPEEVMREVMGIKNTFKGEPRVIIGSGDQVGYETPEENIYAMIEEAKKS